MKCGEEKPICLRCLKYGVQCEGYPNPGSNEAIGKNNTKQKIFHHRVISILPRTSTDVTSIPAVNSPWRSLASCSTPFRDSRQYTYFLHFQEETVRDLSGPIEEGLWSQVSLQACYSEPLLMQLVVAAGALGKSRKMALTDPEARIHKRDAFINYGQALKTIQRRVNGPNPVSPRIMMISSLLIYYLENLTGDVETACAHMRSALPLVHEQLSLRGYKYRHCKPSSSEVDLEDSLVAAFVRLDNILCVNPDLWGNPDGDQILKVDFTITQLPEEFKTLREARSYLEAIQFYDLVRVLSFLYYRCSKRDIKCQQTHDILITSSFSWEHTTLISTLNHLASNLERNGSDKPIGTKPQRCQAHASKGGNN